MAWIESHDDIWEHHKTIRISQLLGIAPVQTVGHLTSLWHFVLRNAWRDADLSPWGDDGIEAAARWGGKRGKMLKALRDCGFIDGNICHGWIERAGKLVYDRLYNEERRKTALERRKAEATVPYPTVPNRTLPNQQLTTAKAVEKSGDKSNNSADDPLERRIPFGPKKGIIIANLEPSYCLWMLEEWDLRHSLSKKIQEALRARVVAKQEELKPGRTA